MLACMWGKGSIFSLLGVGSANLYSQYGNQCGGSSELEIDLPQDPTIALLGIILKGSVSYYRDTCSSIFVTAVFTIARK